MWSLAGQSVGLGAALVATPFTLRLLGARLYGLWALLQSALTWVGLADLGMSNASTRLAGERVANRDDEGEAQAVWTAAAITISVTTLAAAATALASPVILSDVLSVHGAPARSGVTALRILCAALVAQAASGTLNTPQVVRLRWRSYTLVTSGSSVLQVVAVPIALAASNGGVITSAAVACAVTVLAAAVTLWLAARLQPRMLRPRLNRKVVRPLVSYGGALTVSGLAAIPLTTAERLWLGHYRSTVEVAWYVVASRLGTLLSAIPGAVAAPLFPAFVSLNTANEISAARALYRQALQGAFLALTPAAVILAFIAQPFLSAWAGATYAHHSVIPFYIIIIGVWFNSLAWLPLSYLLSADRTALIARVHLIELAPYVALAALLTSTLGALGAAIVWTLRVVVDSVVFFALAHRAGGLPLSPLSSRSIASIAAPVMLAASLAGIAIATTSLAVRLAVAFLALAGYLPLVWRFLLVGRERAGLRALTANILPTRRRGRRVGYDP